ncbi:MAG: undecaprenyl/decaprenyl-phosphate alpha-N-acetylglucosaminyl 1-phosphate transferase [Acidobacteriota bacterium]|nr:undecaprenyl/decaprenyl-phosphate alpha-N-acetylglucosaminyl 1-phosphate transferase [Acidobacteriota bacterium]
MHPTELDALYAFLAAAAITAALTPLTMRFARAVRAVDRPRERGLSDRPVPLLGGLAIFAGTVVAALIWLPASEAGGPNWHGVLLAAAVITLVGAIDDRFDLHPVLKLAGQALAAVLVVHFGVVVKDISVPFVGLLQFPHQGGVITVVGLVALMNVVNFSDGVDGLAAGVSAIIAIALAVAAISLYYEGHHLHSLAPAVFAAIVAGGALGFLVHNFPPASSFMGDCGANLLGLLMGVLAVEATVKTEVVISFVLPLILLTVPFLDTTFVVLKRLKYRRPVYESDNEHFHHRMARIGFSKRRTIAYLYAWTVMLAGLALALRFIPYSDHHGHFNTGWTLVMAGIGALVLAASVYLVYLLEILKFRRLDAIRLRRLRPMATEAEIERDVTEHLETGEMSVVTLPAAEPEQRARQSRFPRGADGTGETGAPAATGKPPAPQRSGG